MASRESGLLFSLERGLGIVLWVRQEKKALTSRGWGLLRGFLELRRPWGFFVLSLFSTVLFILVQSSSLEISKS